MPHRIAIGRPLWMRRIAAIIGCLIVFGVGMLLAAQSSRFTSQTIDTISFNEENFLLENAPSQSETTMVTANIEREIEVRITSNGLLPVRMTAHPGDTIVWINEQTIPHILESQTLVDASGSLLYTPAIFPESREKFTLSSNHASGEFTYTSTTAQNIEGIVVVEEFAEEIPVSSSSEPPIVSSSRSAISSSSESSDFPPIVPVNPYTVDGTRQHPFNSDGNPLDSYNTTRPPTAGHRPAQNAETGPTIWLTIILSLAGFAFVTRRAFQSMRP